MSFKDIPGNAGVKKILVKALKKKKLPNSLLLTGPEGVGKKETALTLARALNCLKKTSDACEECIPCRAIAHGNFPDVVVISPEKDILKIDQMRWLKEMAYLKPMAGRKRVFIVDGADKMNEEAANSLLKILEEPPSFSQIILVTSNLQRIVPTITSRCQAFHFSPLRPEEIEKVLLAKGYSAERARILSLLVRGNLEKALTLEWDEVQSQRTEGWNLLLALLKKKDAGAFFDRFSLTQTPHREEFRGILEILASFCRDLLLCIENGDVRLLLNPDFEDGLKEAAQATDSARVQDLLRLVDDTLAGLDRRLNINILMSAFYSFIVEGQHV
ncbi:MAG: DNA polymerase III subunit delta' [Candidatus Aminicenantales bacterium]